MAHFLKISDWSAEELEHVVYLSKKLKAARARKRSVADDPAIHMPLADRTLAMIFEKPSTRTRVSFEVGMMELGGRAIVLSADDLQLGRGEPLADTAKVLSRYVDAVMIRTTSHARLKTFAEASTVPVINGLTDLHHPTQIIADLLTVLEHKGTLNGVRIAYVGDGNNNVTHSWLEAAALLGLDLAVASPKAYAPDASVLGFAYETAKRTGAKIAVVESPEEAVYARDVVITDVWTSMGREAESEARRTALLPYQVNAALMRLTDPEAIFMHCLPAHRGEEVTTEIIDGPRSVVFDEAENRLHAHKAILLHLFGVSQPIAHLSSSL
ncbi:MAG: ornithine carbamoyltransferase [Hydrogenibacillus sp.]|nr:ornithine carbamoyltransferase [Hydrogenibacillus sp.]